MATRQCIVVVENSTLKLDVLLQERHVLDLFDLLNKAWAVGGYGWYFIHVPDIAGLLNVLVSVDLSLFICPVWKWGGVRPHRDSRGSVN